MMTTHGLVSAYRYGEFLFGFKIWPRRLVLGFGTMLGFWVSKFLGLNFWLKQRLNWGDEFFSILHNVSGFSGLTTVEA